MTDQQLQLALAKMLPEKIKIHNPMGNSFFDWTDVEEEGRRSPVKDTEWLHVCWLLEKTLTPEQDKQFMGELQRQIGYYDHVYFPILLHASWQQRATALVKWKK